MGTETTMSSMTTSKVQTRGREAAVGMTWDDFKALMREELCPNNKMQKMETEFWKQVLQLLSDDPREVRDFVNVSIRLKLQTTSLSS
nr:reverse transcriptase domain-containing protein [Tanacetum cinerariifolium]